MNPHYESTQTGMTSTSNAAAANTRVAAVLDSEFPLQQGSHGDVRSYAMYYRNLVAYLADGTVTGLQKASCLREVFGQKSCPVSIVLDNGETTAELALDPRGCRCGVDVDMHFK